MMIHECRVNREDEQVIINIICIPDDVQQDLRGKLECTSRVPRAESTESNKTGPSV